jgi:hypothetical protein
VLTLSRSTSINTAYIEAVLMLVDRERVSTAVTGSYGRHGSFGSSGRNKRALSGLELAQANLEALRELVRDGATKTPVSCISDLCTFSSSVTISSSVERRTPVGVMTRPENAGCTEVTKLCENWYVTVPQKRLCHASPISAEENKVADFRNCETAFSSSVTISSSVERRTPVGVMTRPENAGCTEASTRRNGSAASRLGGRLRAPERERERERVGPRVDDRRRGGALVLRERQKTFFRIGGDEDISMG